MTRLLLIIIAILAILGVGTLIGFTNMPGDWYAALNKPAFNPPNWIFGPVWTLLYVLIGWAGARTLLDEGLSNRGLVFIGQMTLNFLWSPAFFGLQSPLLGLIVIVPMLILILAFIRLSWTADRLSAIAFIPYAAWVSFATLLNATIYLIN